MPYSAGAAVTVAVANTPVQISAVHKLVKKLLIQPKYSNGGVGFVGDSTLNPNTDTGIFKQLTGLLTESGQFELSETEAPNGIDLFEFWVTSQTANDIFYFSYNEQ